MKKFITFILVFVTMSALTCILAGCKEPPVTEKAAVAFVLANTANSQGLNLSSQLVQDTIYETVRHYGYISVVNCDGQPEIVMDKSCDIDDKYKNASVEKLDMEASATTANLISGMQNLIATDPEVDFWAAVNLALRSLSSLDGYEYKTIIVVGSGLSTCGVLDFTNNLISADPETIIEFLRERNEIPDFTGITLFWQQLGDTSAPQKPLSAAQRKKLIEIYASLVEAGGGEFIYNSTVAAPVNQNVDYPSVTPVDLPDELPIRFGPETLEPFEAAADDTAVDDEITAEEQPELPPFSILEDEIQFIGDKAEYLDPDKAASVLTPVAEFLKKYDHINVLLCGCTAGDTNTDFAMQLSRERAERVKETLIELGIDADRIDVVGLGCGDPWHIYGVGYNGAAASSNRKVVMLDAASQTAAGIMTESNQ